MGNFMLLPLLVILCISMWRHWDASKLLPPDKVLPPSQPHRPSPTVQAPQPEKPQDLHLQALVGHGVSERQARSYLQQCPWLYNFPPETLNAADLGFRDNSKKRGGD